eukprot:CAMPEP_0206534966 /NCGR_PEP_ID=MMETSP0325_2-20121206/5858_1 /ASSEMBLY_ACC=CAM_ASM_000347 /TAXON_ID=2866 /ORGANISM="Crypthecodinium cohnii, Strain Seligo" /LENGTH=193 /DNA_ID=CAMNT_0054031867 /DNA_START=439 /DNA_END=1020 /DNA_ORIENTATION=+
MSRASLEPQSHRHRWAAKESYVRIETRGDPEKALPLLPLEAASNLEALIGGELTVEVQKQRLVLPVVRIQEPKEPRQGHLGARWGLKWVWVEEEVSDKMFDELLVTRQKLCAEPSLAESDGSCHGGSLKDLGMQNPSNSRSPPEGPKTVYILLCGRIPMRGGQLEAGNSMSHISQILPVENLNSKNELGKLDV